MASGLRPRWHQRLVLPGSFALLWWALAGDRPGSWWLGIPLVAVATGLAARETSLVWRISPLALLRFLPFLLWKALTGGADVARRAFDPRLPIDPGFLTLRLRLSGDAAVLLTSMLSLSPGTLTAELEGDRVTLHVVDRLGPVEEQVRATEAAVARLLGVSLVENDR